MPKMNRTLALPAKAKSESRNVTDETRRAVRAWDSAKR
jgi:hypothetical protein